MLGKMLKLAAPDAEPKEEKPSIFTIAKEKKDPSGAAAMKKNFREAKTALEKMIKQGGEKLLLSMVEQPPPPKDPDEPPPPPNYPDDATQRQVKTAMDNLRRSVVERVAAMHE